jgi:flagellar basal-body rod modification protein FlgD
MSAVTDITNQTASAQAALKNTLTTGAEQQMGRNEFLKLLVAQLQNQDPLKPQDNAQFVAELAQFSNLEQTMGINDRLDALSSQNQGLQNSQIVSMVGKTATVRGSMVTADGSAQRVPISFTLDGEAQKVSITLADLNGKAVRTFQIDKAQDAGIVQTTWDGFADDGKKAPAGTYTVTIKATNAKGAAVSSSQETTGAVKSVSFDKGYPVLQLANGVSVPISDLLRVQ